MKITFINDAFCGGGKERRQLRIIQGLNSYGYTDIQIIIINDGIDYPEIKNTTAQIHVINRKSRNLSLFQVYSEIKKCVDNFNPDIVQGWGFLSLFFINFLRMTRKFVYIASHVADCNPLSFQNSVINKICNHLANVVIGNSEAGLDVYGTPSNKRLCIYNGIQIFNSEAVDYESKRKELNVSTKYVISMIARVDIYKDYTAFVNIARSLRKKRSDITFLAVGKGDLLKQFQDSLSKDEEEYIRFLGFRSDINEILQLSTLSLLCTNYLLHGEGISNSILESLNVGTPVIATRGGGTPEIIVNGENGYLVDKNSVEDFTSKIEYLLDDSEAYKNMCENAKKCVRDKFSLEERTQDYIKLYEQLTKK